MQRRPLVIVRTGTANIASVRAALARFGVEATVTVDPQEVQQGERVVLPGVGAFGAAMAELQSHSLLEVLAERIRQGRPTLAICLGLQMLCDASQESPGVRGLGVLPGTVMRFPDNVRVPQLGWNRVEPDSGCKLLVSGHAYFANSYRISEAPAGWSVAWTDYGGRFVAAVERGDVLACQFHPELSGGWGLSLLERWLATAPAKGGA